MQKEHSPRAEQELILLTYGSEVELAEIEALLTLHTLGHKENDSTQVIRTL